MATSFQFVPPSLSASQNAGHKAGTLADVYRLAYDSDLPGPLATVLLSDANVALVEHVLQKKAPKALGQLAPPPELLTLLQCDALKGALFEAARELGYQRTSAATLSAANARVIARALYQLATEQGTWEQWRQFAETGVALDERSTEDYEERAARRELQRPVTGVGIHSPWDAYAEERGLIDHFRPFHGLKPQDVTTSGETSAGDDDRRIRLVPWAPAAVHGRIPWGPSSAFI